MEESLGASTGEGEALPGGCYSVERWGRTFEIEVSQPVTYFDFPYTFGVGDEDPGRSIVLLAEFTGVIPSEKVGTHPPHDDPIGEHMIDVPPDLASWISAAPQIVVTASGEYSIDGDPATWWDVEVDPSAGETFACPFGACVATLVPSPPDARGTNFVMGDAARFRVVQLSGSGTGLFMWVQGSPDGFDEAVALADSIAETLRLAG